MKESVAALGAAGMLAFTLLAGCGINDIPEPEIPGSETNGQRDGENGPVWIKGMTEKEMAEAESNMAREAAWLARANGTVATDVSVGATISLAKRKCMGLTSGRYDNIYEASKDLADSGWSNASMEIFMGGAIDNFCPEFQDEFDNFDF